MISAGKRYPAYRVRAGVVIPTDYSLQRVGASAVRPAKLTVPIHDISSMTACCASASMAPGNG
jgi:hypothetical protein